MMQPIGFEQRDRGKDGEISRSHGTTQMWALRKIYGRKFGAANYDNAMLSEVLSRLDITSLSQLYRDHEGGTLGSKIQEATR
jgi:hypothetical protein